MPVRNIETNWNKPKKILGFREKANWKTTETDRVSVRTEKKIYGFEDPLIENVFGDFFGLFRRNSVCLGCFDTGLKHRNNPKQTENMFFGFVKQTEKQPKQIDFRFVSVWTKKKVLLFRGHPSTDGQNRATYSKARS